MSSHCSRTFAVTLLVLAVGFGGCASKANDAGSGSQGPTSSNDQGSRWSSNATPTGHGNASQAPPPYPLAAFRLDYPLTPNEAPTATHKVTIPDNATDLAIKVAFYRKTTALPMPHSGMGCFTALGCYSGLDALSRTDNGTRFSCQALLGDDWAISNPPVGPWEMDNWTDVFPWKGPAQNLTFSNRGWGDVFVDVAVLSVDDEFPPAGDNYQHACH